LLDLLGHAGFADAQRFRSLGEAAGFHYANEGLHRIETVHRHSRIVWFEQTVLSALARLSSVRRVLQ